MRYQVLKIALTSAVVGCSGIDELSTNEAASMRAMSPDARMTSDEPVEPTLEPAPEPWEVPEELIFSQTETTVTTVACDVARVELDAGDVLVARPGDDGPIVHTEEDGCAPGDEEVELSKDVYVAKFGRDNHVSKASREFDLDGSESNCSSAPALCTSSAYHGIGRTFKVKVKCTRGANPTVKFNTTLGTEVTFPKTETGHYHGIASGYACAKSTGFLGASVSAACKTKGASEIAPQQVVAGAAVGIVSQDLYVAYASTHCGRGLFSELPSFDGCNAPELSAEVEGTGFKFQAKNETYSGKKKVSCTADCAAATPTLDCKEVEDGNL